MNRMSQVLKQTDAPPVPKVPYLEEALIKAVSGEAAAEAAAQPAHGLPIDMSIDSTTSKRNRGRRAAKGPKDHQVVGGSSGKGTTTTPAKARPGKRRVEGGKDRLGASIKGQGTPPKARPSKRVVAAAAARREHVVIGDGATHSSPSKASTTYSSSWDPKGAAGKPVGSPATAIGVSSFKVRRRMAKHVPNAADPKQAQDWQRMMDGRHGGKVAGMTTAKRMETAGRRHRPQSARSAKLLESHVFSPTAAGYKPPHAMKRHVTVSRAEADHLVGTGAVATGNARKPRRIKQAGNVVRGDQSAPMAGRPTGMRGDTLGTGGSGIVAGSEPPKRRVMKTTGRGLSSMLSSSVVLG